MARCRSDCQHERHAAVIWPAARSHSKHRCNRDVVRKLGDTTIQRPRYAIKHDLLALIVQMRQRSNASKLSTALQSEQGLRRVGVGSAAAIPDMEKLT